MAINLQYAGEFEVSSLKIISTKGVEADISKTVMEINVFENLFSSSMSASILLADTNDLASKLPIIGQEFVKMKIQMPSLNKSGSNFISTQIDLIFCLYKIGFRTEIRNGGQMMELHLVTPETLKNHRTRISQSYTDSIDNIVDSVLKDYIQTNRDRLVEKTIGIKKIVVPNMHPYDLIKMLAREAISDNDLGTFIFFENKEGLHFKSLKNLYNSTVIESFEGGSFRMTPLGNGHPATSDVEMEYKRALTYGISGQNDMLANIKSGMLGSSMTTYDSFRKSYYTHTYAHSFKGNDEQLESHSIYSPSLIDKENNQINEFPLSRIHLQSGDENQINTFQGTTVEDTITDGRKLPETFLRRQAKFSELTTGTTMNISVNGNLTLSVGGIVEFNLPTTKAAAGGKEVDPHHSGKYLITSLRHAFAMTGKKSETTMLLSRDSQPAEYLNFDNATEPEPTSKGRGYQLSNSGFTFR